MAFESGNGNLEPSHQPRPMSDRCRKKRFPDLDVLFKYLHIKANDAGQSGSYDEARQNVSVCDDCPVRPSLSMELTAVPRGGCERAPIRRVPA